MNRLNNIITLKKCQMKIYKKKEFKETAKVTMKKRRGEYDTCLPKY